MPTVRFEPRGTSVEVEEGTLVIDAIVRAGLPLGRACGEQGVCGRCRVAVERAPESLTPPDALELRMAAKQGLGRDERLACSARICADVTVSSAAWSRSD